MKKIVLLAALIALCFGCEQPENPNPNPQPEDTTWLVGTWSVTYVTICNEFGEVIDSGHNLSVLEIYKFHADNSGWARDYQFKAGYEIRWELKGNELCIIKGDEYTGVWLIEEQTDTEMVLSIQMGEDSIGYFTFKKIEPQNEQPQDTTGLAGIWNAVEVIYDESGEITIVDIDKISGVQVYIFHADGRGWGKNQVFQTGFELDWTLAGDQLTVVTDESTLPFHPTDQIYTRVWTVVEKTETKLVLSTSGLSETSYYTFQKIE